MARQDGVLEIWDLIEATHQPLISDNLAPCALTCLSCSKSATAKSGTVVTLLAIGRHLNIEIPLLLLVAEISNLSWHSFWASFGKSMSASFDSFRATCKQRRLMLGIV